MPAVRVDPQPTVAHVAGSTTPTGPQPQAAPAVPDNPGHGVAVAEFDLDALSGRAPTRVDLSWQPSVSSAEVERLEDRLLDLAKGILKGSASDSAEEEIAGILSKLKAPIQEAKERLAALRTNMKEQYATFRWWQRYINNPSSYDTKQEVESDLATWLEDARSIRGGARIALRIRQAQKAAKTPETWAAEQELVVREMYAAHKQPTWSSEIADLARFQKELRKEKIASRAEANNREQDVDDYDEMTWFWQRPRWLDILTLGTCTKGELYRAGNTQTAAADDLADRFAAVFGAGEDRLNAAINKLLRHEDPAGYGKTRDAYELVKPAYERLRSVERAAQTVLSRLSSVDSAISHAAMVRAMGAGISPTITRTDSKGNTRVETNPSYTSWQAQVRMAESSVIAAKSSASSAVRSLNSKLPDLKTALENNNLQAFLGPVGDDIGTWHNWLFGFGMAVGGWGGLAMWSYDSSQVSSVRSKVHQLQGKLAPVDAIVTPRYNELHTEVWRRINERRSELVANGA